MSNQVKSDIDFKLEELEELLPEENNSKYALLIKHDYYSSDNDHGRSLLLSIIENIDWSMVSDIYIIDSGVKIFNNQNLIDIIKFYSSIDSAKYICKDSLDFYEIKISLEDISSFAIPLTTDGIISRILSEPNLRIIE